MSNKPTLSIDEILDYLLKTVHPIIGDGQVEWPVVAEKEAKQQLTQLIGSIIGERLTESDGWDKFFTDNDKCCPGDDFADYGNEIKSEQRQRARDLGVDL